MKRRETHIMNPPIPSSSFNNYQLMANLNIYALLINIKLKSLPSISPPDSKTPHPTKGCALPAKNYVKLTKLRGFVLVKSPAALCSALLSAVCIMKSIGSLYLPHKNKI